MDIRELYNAVLGFNITEKDAAGRVISRPVKPVFLALEGPNRRRLQVGFLQQLSWLLRMGGPGNMAKRRHCRHTDHAAAVGCKYRTCRCHHIPR